MVLAWAKASWGYLVRYDEWNIHDRTHLRDHEDEEILLLDLT